MKISKNFAKKIIRHESLYRTNKYAYWMDYNVDTDSYTIFRCKEESYFDGYCHTILNGGEPEEMTIPASEIEE